MKVTATVTVSIATCILLASCSSTPVEPGEVKAKWSQNMRQLGIVPVFPPREDLLVGDIYSYNYNPENEKLTTLLNTDYDELEPHEKAIINKLGMSPRLARFDLETELNNEYEKSLSAPATSKDYNDILDNPAIAAMDSKISAKASEVAAFDTAITNAKNKKTQDANNLLSLTHKKEDATAAAIKANAVLSDAKKRPDTPADTSDLDKQIQDQNVIKRRQEDAVVQAAFDVVEAGTDQGKLAIANTAKRKADFELAKTNTKITRLEEDKNNLKGTPYNPETEQSAYDQAVVAQDQADRDLLVAKRDKAKSDESNDAIISAKTEKKTVAETKLTELKETKKSLVLVGSQTLFKQPSYKNTNVFNAEILCTPDADDLSKCTRTHEQTRVNRLRLVAFPEFSSTTVSQSDLSALIPAEALSLNITASSVESVSLKIPAAESYSLSTETVFKKLFTIDNSTGEIGPDTVLAGYLKVAQFLQEKSSSKSKEEYFYLRVITEVYYARAFDISIFANSSFGGSLNYAKPPEATTSGEAINENSEDYSYFNGVIDSSTPADSGNYLSKLKENLTNTSTVPGGTIQVLHSSESAIGLRRVYDRPIAVGFRGMTIRAQYCEEANCTPVIVGIDMTDGNSSSYVN
ncbi:hypothetical protein Q4591_07090 [Shewanella sp. 3_MG-2023]|uniref:hypothetical protein n=1 Tax=Shewanella sp. 3_MG-2023 TaxID=3062635 RepID=UPI0026E3F7A6|nr:hypothetical protein [Shewanella sp. 3_MG-2023]MDO6775115.1 hypothetical protein [Shewanella sp. 3_MG-2023]